MGISVHEMWDYPLEAKRGRYEQKEVDAYVGRLLTNLVDVKSERDELAGRVAKLEHELGEVRELERELRDSLVAAQRVARELRETAKTERDQILQTARDEAADLRDRTKAELEELSREVERLRNLETQVKTGYRQFLAAALELLESSTGDAAGPDGAKSDHPEAELPRVHAEAGSRP